MLNRTSSLTSRFRHFCALPRRRYDEPEVCRNVVNSQLAYGKGLFCPEKGDLERGIFAREDMIRLLDSRPCIPFHSIPRPPHVPMILVSELNTRQGGIEFEGYHGRLGQDGAADLAEELDWHKASGVDSGTHIQSRQYSDFDGTATGDTTTGNAAAGNTPSQPGSTTMGNTWTDNSFAGTAGSGITVTPSGGEDECTAASPWSPGSSAPGGGAPTTTSGSSGTPASWGGSGGSSSASASPGTKASGSWMSGNAGDTSGTGTRPNGSGFSPSSSGSSAMAGFGLGSGDKASKGCETVSSALGASGTASPGMPAPWGGSSSSSDGTAGSWGSGAGTGDTGYGNDCPSTLPSSGRASTPNEPAESGAATKDSEAVDSAASQATASMEAPDPSSNKVSVRTKRSTETEPVNGGGNTSNGVNGGATNTGGGTNVNVITSPTNGGETDKGTINTLLDKLSSIIKTLR